MKKLLSRNNSSSISEWVTVVLCTLYIISPIDLIPDFIPVAGWIDDLAALIIGLTNAINGVSSNLGYIGKLLKWLTIITGVGVILYGISSIVSFLN